MTNTLKLIQGHSKDNDIILSQMLAQEVQKARRKKFPTAEDILGELGR